MSLESTRLTPVMQQYRRLKAEHENAILFFRLGDFFEMFFEDAVLAARELEITLTSRDGGGGQRVPMCGVPHHAAEIYIGRLVERGHRVAVCEQAKDPQQAKGLVRREVVRVVTPGTLMDERLVGEKRNRYLAAVASGSEGYGLAYADISTGEFVAGEFRGEHAGRRVCDDLGRIDPVELLTDAGSAALIEALGREGGPAVARVEEESRRPERARRRLQEHFGTAGLVGFGLEGLSLAISAAGALLSYLEETQRGSLPQITGLRLHSSGESMNLDAATRRNLELTARLGDGRRQGSLLSVLDRTVTAMGGRLLRRWLDSPLISLDPIRERLAAVGDLAEAPVTRAELRDLLKGVYDLERLISRVACNRANARDLAALRSSLERLPRLREILCCRSPALLRRLGEDMGDLAPVTDLIARAIVDDPPVALNEGGLIRPGYDSRVDELRLAGREGKEWIAALEERERDRAGIRSLKVGFNKVFGYYIEVTRANLHLVPDDYVRKQTLANAERYVTTALKDKEAAVLGAEEKLLALEYDLFCLIRERIADQTAAVQEAARAVAEVDTMASLAEVAVSNGYVRPEVDEGLEITLEGARHPVLEQVLGPGMYVPNDIRLDGGEHRFLLITGPNMAGKSSLARQVALAAVMAQIGCFIPASAARIGLVDRVFTRIGAADDLFSGQSTFMVEMNEVANILHNATARSLVILDEVGRGTSTFDGLSLAWAVSEDLHVRVRARTIFTTHYHELTALEDLLPGVRNFTMAVKEKGEEVIFLRRLVPGGADRSYGIQVARLAGLPPEVLRRAMEVLRELEHSREVMEARREAAAGAEKARAGAGDGAGDGQPHDQVGLLPPPEQLEAIRLLLSLRLPEMTPLEALNRLFQLQRLARGADKE